MSRRRIAIFTGNRAEYGLLLPVIRAVDAHPGLDYRLVVSGAHLDPDFGGTLAEIEADGITVHAEVKIDVADDTLGATAHAIGSGVIETTRALAALAPDIFVVYADRFEGFAAVIAGTQTGVPTAHIEGGDLTEGGALDDSVRHAMTKLAHLHFTTNAQATNRILAMGEEPWRVHTVGFPMIDRILAGRFATPEEIAERLGVDPTRPIAVFTQHSITTEADLAEAQVAPSLQALARLAGEGVQVIATYPNNDAGGRRIIAALEATAATAPAGFQLRRSLGSHLYHGLLSLARDPAARVACVGNSSSGIKETPAFGCPTVNIGMRQAGRLRAENVIDVGNDAEAIVAAVRRCFDDAGFRARCRGCGNPYGTGDAGTKIADILAAAPLGQKMLRKGMTLRGEARDGWYR